MEINAVKIFGILLFLSHAIFYPTNANCNPNKKGQRMERAADKVWRTFKSPGYFLEADIDACHADEHCFWQIAEIWRKSGIEDKRLTLEKFPAVGGQLRPVEDQRERRYGPYLVEEALIEVAVEALSVGDGELRNIAGRILSVDTPDSLVRDHSRSIEIAMEKYPETVGAARLMGKLKSNKARKILAGSKALREDNPDLVEAVFGKLGDSGREARLIGAYQAEKDPKKKAFLASMLGYMATPKSLLLLADELRTPYFYEWNQKGRRSFRLHVISALSIAYPFEPVLWKPRSYPSGDGYYEAIEAWGNKVLGVEWKQPRPPFLYEEQVPMAKPPIKPQ